MHVYAALDDPRMPLREVPAYAQRAERMGFTGLLVPEAVHDGFLTSLLALEHTTTLQVLTSVVLAFPLGLGGSGIWTGLFAGLAVVSLLLLRRWLGRERLGLVGRHSA